MRYVDIERAPDFASKKKGTSWTSKVAFLFTANLIFGASNLIVRHADSELHWSWNRDRLASETDSFRLIAHARLVGFRFHQFVCEHLESSNLNYSLVTGIPRYGRCGWRFFGFSLGLLFSRIKCYSVYCTIYLREAAHNAKTRGFWHHNLVGQDLH